MANICIYKVMVKGRKRACYALVDMMPLYTSDKEMLIEEGTEEDFTLVFTGDCKWYPDAYTKAVENLAPFTEEELSNVKDGDYWNLPLLQKSLALGCDIYCNSKDIDAGGKAYYEHYYRGLIINDECPKEIHIKRGREYDWGFVEEEREKTPGTECKVKFEKGSYMYLGDYAVGDIVLVEGAKSGCLGRVIQSTKTNNCNTSYYKIIEKVGHAQDFSEKKMENIWNSFSPTDRKAWLVQLGMDEKTTKKKFLSVMDARWTKAAYEKNTWEEFENAVQNPK